VSRLFGGQSAPEVEEVRGKIEGKGRSIANGCEGEG